MAGAPAAASDQAAKLLEEQAAQLVATVLSNVDKPYIIRLVKKLPAQSQIDLCNYILDCYKNKAIEGGTKGLKAHIVSLLSVHAKHKPFKEMGTVDVLAWVEANRKDENDPKDPMHKWKGYYNKKVIESRAFFKWLYNPDKPLRDRKVPQFMDPIRPIVRSERTCYTPEMIWNMQDAATFLKWAPNTPIGKRDKCYVAMDCEDTGARPHELLQLRTSSPQFKVSSNKKRYARVTLKPKKRGLKPRTVPIFHSIPYLKDWLGVHPYAGDPNAPLFCSMGDRTLGKPIKTSHLADRFRRYYARYFKKLAKDESIPEAERAKIRQLSERKFNLYIQRHSGLTEIAKKLKDGAQFRQNSGMSINSKMPEVYVHWFNMEAGESLLQEWGIETEEQKEEEKLTMAASCPNCKAANRPDAYSCLYCGQVMNMMAYQQALEDEAAIQKQMADLKAEFDAMKANNATQKPAEIAWKGAQE